MNGNKAFYWYHLSCSAGCPYSHSTFFSTNSFVLIVLSSFACHAVLRPLSIAMPMLSKACIMDLKMSLQSAKLGAQVR
jgi:hypothetical protein